MHAAKFAVVNVLLCAVLASPLAGCDGFTFVEPELPADVKFVYENAERFIATSDGPLSDVTPGTVIEPLDALNGCWGIARPSNNVNVPYTDIKSVDAFDVMHFDAATQEIIHTWKIHDLGGLITVVVVDRGTFEVLDASTVRLTYAAWSGNDPTTGQFDPETAYDQPVEATYELTLSGDRLALMPVDGELPDGQSHPVYVQFDCP